MKIRLWVMAGILMLSSLSAWADPEVEIYAKGRLGTQEDPLKAGFWASFSCRIDGVECFNFGPIFFWKTDPALEFKFTDTADPTFRIPSFWLQPTNFDVTVTIEQGPAAGEYSKAFWARVVDDGGGGGGGGSGSNDPPENVAISYQVIGQTVSLSGSANDPDNDSLTWLWYVDTTGFQRGTLFASTRNASYPSSLNDQWFTLEVSDGVNTAVSQKIKVDAGSGGGGIVSPPEGPTPQTCADCSSGKSPEVDAGLTVLQIKGGDTLKLAGSFQDRNPFTGAIIARTIESDWEILNDQDPGVQSLIASGLALANESRNNTDVTADLVTPEVTEDTVINVQLSVSVDGCGCADTVEVHILRDDPVANANPEARLAISQTEVGGGQKVTLDGSESFDNDGQDLQYEWTIDPLVPDTDIVSEAADNSIISFNAPKVDEDTTLSFSLRVSDGISQSAPVQVQLVVLANQAPVINRVLTNLSPDDQLVGSGALVTLDAEAEDPDGDDITYNWTQESGPPSEIAEPDQASTSFTAPQVEDETTLVFKLTVSDGVSPVEHILEIVVRPAVLNSLVFPMRVKTGHPMLENTFVGVAVVNTTGGGNQVSIAGSNADGVSVPTEQLPLAAFGQTAFVTSQAGAPEDSSSLTVNGTSGPVQGFFMVGDHALSRLDGIGGELVESENLYFPIARHSDSEATLLYLFNPNLDQEVEANFVLYGKSGEVIRETTHTIAAGGTLMQTLDSIFTQDQSSEGEGEGEGEGASAVRLAEHDEADAFAIEDGFLNIQTSAKVKGFQFLVSESDLSSMAGQVGTQTRQLLVPHFFIGSGEETELRLLNTGATDVQVVLSAFDDKAADLGQAEFLVKRNNLFVGNLSELLGIDRSTLDENFGLITGYLRLDLSGGKVGVFERDATMVGTVTFSGNGGKTRSTLPMLTEGRRETLFLHVAQSLDLNVFTGLAVANFGDEKAQVQVEAFDADGNSTGLVEFDLGAGKRRVDLLDGSALFGTGFVQTGGHFRVTSDQPVVTFSLFGDWSSVYLSAIEGQAPIR